MNIEKKSVDKLEWSEEELMGGVWVEKSSGSYFMVGRGPAEGAFTLLSVGTTCIGMRTKFSDRWINVQTMYRDVGCRFNIIPAQNVTLVVKGVPNER